jgi:hypothetical protein
VADGTPAVANTENLNALFDELLADESTGRMRLLGVEQAVMSPAAI